MEQAADPAKNREIELALARAGGMLDKLSTLHVSQSARVQRRSATRMSFLARGVSESLRRKQGSGISLTDGSSLLDESEADDLALPSGIADEDGRDWEFDRASLKRQRDLGEGQFGTVWEGVATGLVKGEPATKVAVKQLNDADGERDFRKEAQIQKALSGCNRIVQLLGICTKSRPLLMLMELMPKGDLKTCLRTARPKAKHESPLSLQDMAQMLNDIAIGMEFLSRNRIVHRDLAARNCLVDDDYRVKIGDFGLTRNLYAKEYYRQAEKALLPVRWMAPEALTDGVFTTAGDVWSFGVVVWEVVSFAKLPYSLWTNHEVYENVCEEDYRLPKPKLCPPELFAVAERCWTENVEDRPLFSDIVTSTAALIPKMPREKLLHRKHQPKVDPAEPKVEVAPTDGNESGDSFEASGLAYMIPASGSPGPEYYKAAQDGPPLTRKATVWLKK